MAIDEQRLRVRRSLEEKLGMEEASYLMDRPAGGWSELVTNHTLDLKLAVVEAKIDALRFELKADMVLGFRRQTWALLSVSIAGFTAVLAALAALVAVT